MAAVVKNKQVIFRDYIKTCPKESDMVVRDDIQGISLKVEEGSNAVLLQNLYLSCDPYVRNRMAKIDHPSHSSYRSFIPSSGIFLSCQCNILFSRMTTIPLNIMC
ncbi:hypothetical protein Ancab_010404 [Ancistrocladus abbreviatus]